jgi:putative aldouronate transport system substrate-binding protein
MEAEPVLKLYNGFVYDEFVGAPTNTMVLRSANLTTLEEEAFFSIIMGEPISRFDDFVRDWRSQGGDAITTEVSAWYRSVR